ncbi:Uncharacterized damage-inducible protein DinB (forms a four-helix bundle) [Ohtaekwangia koreensis]|uniref:Uncharacterized damage-inducible protein DinB (Forms a four-helix bundle) n=1 Tax=Ohtaekwangia koreensis TaxID=688867 RepID=A0A1T5LFN0_9BACT|nr:Uncharacterized damage-inducible protein DinB (forms a four-helix bundle) [Ohtaekwangia koreensis]
MEYAVKQYQLVRASRAVAMDYYHHVGEKLFFKVDTFNSKSISDLLVHIAHVYTFWLGNFALKKNLAYIPINDVSNLHTLQRLYQDVDVLVEEFLENFKNGSSADVSGRAGTPPREITRSPLEIFTHVLTHEFHHKGQILIMGRLLGFPPPDTDIIHF